MSVKDMATSQLKPTKTTGNPLTIRYDTIRYFNVRSKLT